MQKQNPYTPIPVAEWEAFLRRAAENNKASAIAMGYSGEKSLFRHLADDLPDDYVPPVPISLREEINEARNVTHS